MSSETSSETRRVLRRDGAADEPVDARGYRVRRRVRPDAFYKEIVLSNYERLVYSPAGCTPRLSSILLVFLAPIFFLGLGGNIFCAYWYLVDETGV